MYKDKDKQKEANRRASQKRRAKAKGMTDVLTNEQYVIPESDTSVIPKAKDFRGLPVDVQRSIMRISEDDEEVRGRTTIALDYQRQFPNSVHRGTGL